VLERIPPERFVRLLAASEIAIGSALLVPVVPSFLAGLGPPHVVAVTRDRAPAGMAP
jgi:hypothetical protein